jgi:RNA polymerase sigma-70 factor (ECF subfamily)
VPDSAPVPEDSSAPLFDAYWRFRSQLRACFARGMPRHPGLVDDLMQITYEQLLRLKPGGVRDPEAYVFTVARNVLRVWLRSARREEHRYVRCEDEELESYAADLNGLWLQDDSGLAVAEAEFDRILNQLPRASRVALLRQVRDGWTYRQIATELGVSPNTVKDYIVKALNHFRLHYSMRPQR